MIAPLQKDDELLADIMSAEPARDDFSLWWLGQSGFLFKCNGTYTIIDPYLSDSLTSKYESSQAFR
jgi:L-ascorbate metabolism protein UlaG (beta-lactamase superfamily)